MGVEAHDGDKVIYEVCADRACPARRDGTEHAHLVSVDRMLHPVVNRRGAAVLTDAGLAEGRDFYVYPEVEQEPADGRR